MKKRKTDNPPEQQKIASLYSRCSPFPQLDVHRLFILLEMISEGSVQVRMAVVVYDGAVTSELAMLRENTIGRSSEQLTAKPLRSPLRTSEELTDEL
ncbi:hypothetical protein TNCT_42341 [Trichonephila clavata]|uniref:Uncharacterized protein n=1 Tax=Trichonephila clavata TaxID=2740835 RepID=A0A8X6H6F0_TRICU|nr:hypothetical protein TNCT_42341 [Trichonephila clavata]